MYWLSSLEKDTRGSLSNSDGSVGKLPAGTEPARLAVSEVPESILTNDWLNEVFGTKQMGMGLFNSAEVEKNGGSYLAGRDFGISLSAERHM
jgi:hypothetical protein